MGWTEVQNGALLKLATENGFGAPISADKNMEYRQNPTGLAIPVVVLATRDNRLPALQPLVPSVVELLDTVPPPGFYRIETSPRRRSRSTLFRTQRETSNAGWKVTVPLGLRSPNGSACT